MPNIDNFTIAVNFLVEEVRPDSDEVRVYTRYEWTITLVQFIDFTRLSKLLWMTLNRGLNDKYWHKESIGEKSLEYYSLSVRTDSDEIVSRLGTVVENFRESMKEKSLTRPHPMAY